MAAAFVTHADCFKHDMGAHHPECPARLTAIEDQLIASGIGQHLVRHDAPLATDEQLARVHPIEYVRAIRDAAPESGTVHLDPDTAMNRFSLQAALRAAVDVVGVVSTAAPAFARSIELGAPVSMPVTTRIADGMACRTPVSAAFALLRDGLARVVSVTDDEVEAAMRHLFSDTHNAAEGAGAAGFAAAMQERGQLPDEVAVILCGGNVDRRVFAGVLAED